MRTLLVIILLVVTVGCTATLRPLMGRTPSPAGEYIRRSNAHEQAHELRQALLAWRVASRLDPSNAAITGNIQRIEQQIARLAREHYQKAMALLQAGKPDLARHEFLKVLLVDPEHRQSLYLLKTRLRQPHRPVYKVKAGDSFSKIALATYNDPTKAYIVADFNGLNPRKPLRIGTVLILPELDARYILPRSDIEQFLARARKAMAQKQYARAASIAGRIIKEVPGHPQASRLAASARLHSARELTRRGRYHEALELLQQNPPRQQGRAEALAEIRRLISQQALDEKLAAARSLKEKGNHNAVMAITETILADHPDHAEARTLQNEAGYTIGKTLIEQDQADQAIVWLEKVDAGYADTARQLTVARARTKAAAEEHYRDGVKHFINEDLETAIEDWQRALDLNPDHPKARQDMENAMRLLEKWRDLDKTLPEGTATD